MTQWSQDLIPPESRADPAGVPIAFVTQNVSFGGMEVHTLGLMSALLDRGYSIELVENRHRLYDDTVRQNGWDDRVRIVHSDLTGILYGDRSDRRGWRQVFGALESQTLIFPKGNYNYGQIGFLKECRRAFKKVVFVEHLEPHQRPKSAARRFGIVPAPGLWWRKRKVMSRWGSRYADTIVAVSGKVRERLVGDMGFAPTKVVVIRNGVPWQRFVRSSDEGRAARVRYGIPAESFVFGMLSRLSHEKGIDTAIRAVRLVADQCADRAFCLVIAGEGYEADRLKTLADDLGLQHYVKFIGFVSNPVQALSAYDVILFSSRVEGLPLGLLQGMAAGCIPIVTRISGMPEAVNSLQIGWVVTPESPEALADAMRCVLSLDADTIATMRQNAVSTVRDRFDITRANAAFMELCQP